MRSSGGSSHVVCEEGLRAVEKLNEQNGLPLKGMRVIALENMLSGPYASMMLADAGAEVIKVEPPRTGEIGRAVGPPLRWDGDQVGGMFLRVNRHKKSVTINLKKPEGIAIVRELISQSDVLLENFRPGVLRRLGLDWETLHQENPRLIHASISGFGDPEVAPSQYADRPAVDIVVQAMSGLMDMVGDSADGYPLWLGNPLCDLVAGMVAAYAIALALLRRQVTGLGARLDVALYDVAIAMNERVFTSQAISGERLTRGQGHAGTAPWDSFRARDGHFAVGVVSDAMWKELCRVIGREGLGSDPDFAAGPERVRRQREIKAIIETWAADRTCRDVCSALVAAGVPAGPVWGAGEGLSSPHVVSRGLFVEVAQGDGPAVPVVGPPFRFAGSDALKRGEVPGLGQHTGDVLGRFLGYDQKRLNDLRAAGVI